MPMKGFPHVNFNLIPLHKADEGVSTLNFNLIPLHKADEGLFTSEFQPNTSS